MEFVLKFWISNISIFFEKENHSFAEFFDKISDAYNKTIQNFLIFLKTIDR